MQATTIDTYSNNIFYPFKVRYRHLPIFYPDLKWLLDNSQDLSNTNFIQAIILGLSDGIILDLSCEKGPYWNL